MRALLAYRWPGNVRELQNALEYATTVCEGQTIHVGDIPLEIGHGMENGPGSTPYPPSAPPEEPVGDFARESAAAFENSRLDLTPEEAQEVARIRSALQQAHYRRGEAAKILGMSRTTLWRKMKEFRL
jgi:DNA-binding NtrC family response regulator